MGGNQTLQRYKTAQGWHSCWLVAGLQKQLSPEISLVWVTLSINVPRGAALPPESSSCGSNVSPSVSFLGLWASWGHGLGLSCFFSSLLNSLSFFDSDLPAHQSLVPSYRVPLWWPFFMCRGCVNPPVLFLHDWVKSVLSSWPRSPPCSSYPPCPLSPCSVLILPSTKSWAVSSLHPACKLLLGD